MRRRDEQTATCVTVFPLLAIVLWLAHTHPTIRAPAAMRNHRFEYLHVTAGRLTYVQELPKANIMNATAL